MTEPHATAMTCHLKEPVGERCTCHRYFLLFPTPSDTPCQRQSILIRSVCRERSAFPCDFRGCGARGRSRLLESQHEAGHAPYLRALMNDTANQRPIATCMPSTTVAAMSYLRYGNMPRYDRYDRLHALNPKTDEICQLISFKNAIPPLELQQQPTIFERLSAQDVRVTSSGLPKFAFSALTQAALRGSDYISNDDPRKRIAAAGSKRQKRPD